MIQETRNLSPLLLKNMLRRFVHVEKMNVSRLMTQINKVNVDGIAGRDGSLRSYLDQIRDEIKKGRG